MKRKRKRCKDCDKFSYSHESALHAALGTSRSVGLSVRIYECPKVPGVFHLTTRTKGRGYG